MDDNARAQITITASIHATPEQVWQCWTLPEHITKWNQASDDWHTPHAENDLRVGGRFSSRMESKDGKYGFDFWGVYDLVEPFHRLDYTIGDGRAVHITMNRSTAARMSSRRSRRKASTPLSCSVKAGRQFWTISNAT